MSSVLSYLGLYRKSSLLLMMFLKEQKAVKETEAQRSPTCINLTNSTLCCTSAKDSELYKKRLVQSMLQQINLKLAVAWITVIVYIKKENQLTTSHLNIWAVKTLRAITSPWNLLVIIPKHPPVELSASCIHTKKRHIYWEEKKAIWHWK